MTLRSFLIFLLGLVEVAIGVLLIAAPFIWNFSSGWTTVSMIAGLVVLVYVLIWSVARNPRGGISALALGTSRDIEAGEHTVIDE